MFGAKSAKTHNVVVDVSGRCDVVASDFYVSQLRNFIAKNSNASFEYCKHQQKQEAEHQHQTYLPNSSEPKNQHKDFKCKCKRAVYNFMKGLLDQRKFKNIKNINQEEPIYFEVSLFFHFFHHSILCFSICVKPVNICYIKNGGISKCP